MVPANLQTLLPTLPPDRQKAIDALEVRREIAGALLDEAYQDTGHDAEVVARLSLRAVEHKLTPQAFLHVGRIVSLALELRQLFQHRVSEDLLRALRDARGAKSDSEFNASLQYVELELDRWEGKCRHANMTSTIFQAALATFGVYGPAIFSEQFQVSDPAPGGFISGRI